MSETDQQAAERAGIIFAAPQGLPPSTAVTATMRPAPALTQPMSGDEMQAWWRTAEAFVASGAFKGVQDVALAYVKILLGRDLGLNPAQSMMGIDLVRGNLQLRGTLLARMVRESPIYDYERVESDAEHCITDFYGISKRTREWTLLGREEFSVEDAKKGGIYQRKADSGPGAWQTWPKNMCFWRTISNGVKMHCPDLLGGVPVYTEADDFRSIPAIGAASQEDAPAPEWSGVSVRDAAEVEKVVRRAERLGHKGLANLAAARMALNDQPPSVVLAWLNRARVALAALAHPDEPTDEDQRQAEEEAQANAGGEREPEQPSPEMDPDIALARQAVAAALTDEEEKIARRRLAQLEARRG